MKKNRRWLYIVLAGGLIALGAGGGTFASFNAQTTNPGNSFTTGNLYLSDNASATTCFSYNGTNNQNPSGCAAILTATNERPGQTPTGQVNLTNTGTLSAGAISVAAPTTGLTTCQDVNAPSAYATFANSSTAVTLTYGLPTAPAVGSIVTDLTTPGNIASGTTVSSVSGNSVTLSQGSAGASAASPGDELVFTATAANATPALCNDLEPYIEETTPVAECLYPVEAAGTCTPSGSDSLTNMLSTLATPVSFTQTISPGSTAAFTVGIFMPNNGAGADNDLMNLASQFGLTWTITQQP